MAISNAVRGKVAEVAAMKTAKIFALEEVVCDLGCMEGDLTLSAFGIIA